MRRKDREMGVDFALHIIDKADFATLAVMDEKGSPYAIPISPVRIGNKIYIHSAKGGQKVDLFFDGARVCMVFVGRVQVPELYSDTELDAMAIDETKASLLARKVFTTEFESAIVKGTISLIKEEAERREAFTALCHKYCPSKERLVESAIQAGGSRANIYAISIAEITAKRKQYDSNGEEIKLV